MYSKGSTVYTLFLVIVVGVRMDLFICSLSVASVLLMPLQQVNPTNQNTKALLVM